MSLIDTDELNTIKFHPLPYTHIVPDDVNAESYERGWNDAVDSIIENATTIEPERKTGKWIPCSETVDIPDHEVLACDKYGEYIIGLLAYEDEQWLCESEETMMYDPIAWMPLPEPIKIDGRDKWE